MKSLILPILLLFAYICNVSGQVKTYYFTEGQFMGGFFDKVSNNGEYVVGSNPGSLSGMLFIKDSEETMEVFPVIENGKVDLKDVSDEGVIVGLFTDPYSLSEEDQTPCAVPGMYDYKSDEWTALNRPEGVKVVGGGFSGSATSISSDGKLISGYLPTAGKRYVYNGVIWNGNNTISSILPDPQKNAGAKINSISDDGSVACGWTEDAMYGKVAIWKNGELLPISKGGHGTVVSPNGKYIGGNYMDGKHRFGAPFIWSEETGIVSIDHPEGIFTGEVSGISDNGRVAVGHIDFKSMTDHHPFIVIDGEYHDFDEYMWSEYGIKGPNGESFFTIGSMSADGKVMCGFALVDDARSPWILVFEEPLYIKNVAGGLTVNVYPNPVSEILNIEGKYTSVSIYDNLGRGVLHDNSNTGKVNISGLEEGVYFTKVINNGQSQTFKICVNHSHL